ncbi:hypothetical protein AB0D29_26990 [Streptomyces sp. NPDC048424]|uniref:hypothetical protein n=1 Tax=Streptomyces sp. NPDC048424 TaxID=3155265 RepID=UPI00342FB926
MEAAARSELARLAGFAGRADAPQVLVDRIARRLGVPAQVMRAHRSHPDASGGPRRRGRDNRIKDLLLDTITITITFVEGDTQTCSEDIHQPSRALDGPGLRDDQDMHFEALATAAENAELTTF